MRALLLLFVGIFLTNCSLKAEGSPMHHEFDNWIHMEAKDCLLYTSPSPRDTILSRMPSSA